MVDPETGTHTGVRCALLSLGAGECGLMSSCLPSQVITLEGWVDIMYYVMDAHSFYNFIYFILLIIVSVGMASWWPSYI